MKNSNWLQLGRINRLRVLKQVDFGFYLDGGEKYGEILLPNGEILSDIDIHLDDELDVFLYLDTEERLR